MDTSKDKSKSGVVASYCSYCGRVLLMDSVGNIYCSNSKCVNAGGVERARAANRDSVPAAKSKVVMLDVTFLDRSGVESADSIKVLEGQSVATDVLCPKCKQYTILMSAVGVWLRCVNRDCRAYVGYTGIEAHDGKVKANDEEYAEGNGGDNADDIGQRYFQDGGKYYSQQKHK